MAGYTLIRRIRILEEKCDELGFLICHAREFQTEFGDILAIKPKDDCLPVYSRDAEVFVGTISDLERFIQGIEWARKYDSMMFGRSHDLKRARKEQDIRNKQLVDILKGEKVDNKSTV